MLFLIKSYFLYFTSKADKVQISNGFNVSFQFCTSNKNGLLVIIVDKQTNNSFFIEMINYQVNTSYFFFINRYAEKKDSIIFMT